MLTAYIDKTVIMIAMCSGGKVISGTGGGALCNIMDRKKSSYIEFRHIKQIAIEIQTAWKELTNNYWKLRYKIPKL